MHKFLGIALCIGGLLIGGIIVWLMWLYALEDRLTDITAVAGAILGLLVLSLPQFILGAYLLRAG